MQGMIEAVVFDLDGTLIDSEQVVFDAWLATFAAYDCELTLEEWLPSVGTDHGFDPLELLASRASGRLPDRAQLRAELEAQIVERLAATPPLPGTEAWIEQAQELGLKLAVASSSPVEWVDARLREHGLRARFEVLSCRGGSLRAKPAPDVYLAACARLDVAPATAVAIEDSGHGVQAALAAGLKCIAVPNTMTVGLDLSAATLTLPSLAGYELAEAIRLLESRPGGRGRPIRVRSAPGRA
jgi:HAD superfamily hydrolase (TIGR01509 family)